MSGEVVERLPHSCGTRRGLNVFKNPDGTYSGWCFQCKKYIPNPYEDKPADYKPPVGFKKTQEEVDKELNAIAHFKSFPLADRGISKETCEYFGIVSSVSEEDGETIQAHYYPYYREGALSAYKVRMVKDKKFWAIPSLIDVELFGWQQAIRTGSKKLIITEGELDVAAAFQMLKENNKRSSEYAEYNPAVVSLSAGAGSAFKELSKHSKEIRKYFKEIVLAFDKDAPGEEAIREAMKVFPDALVAAMPAKDANACLLEGRSKAFVASILFNANTPKNTRIVLGDDLFVEAKEPPSFGVPWPWGHITEATRGIRLGETIYIGAGQKQGKSEVVNTLASHLITHQGWPVLLAKPEENNKKTIKMVAGKVAGKIFHDPKKPFDEAAYDKAVQSLKGKLYLLNLYQHVGWESLKADIREAAAIGCKAVFIDPITNLVNGMNAADANTKLQEIAQELSSMALDLNIVIFIFCHLRNPDSGLPHERGGEVLSSQFAGSRAMARSCNLMLGLEGNRDPNLSREERNMRTLVLLEDREFGETGRYKLFWDEATGLFNEV